MTINRSAIGTNEALFEARCFNQQSIVRSRAAVDVGGSFGMRASMWTAYVMLGRLSYMTACCREGAVATAVEDRSSSAPSRTSARDAACRRRIRDPLPAHHDHRPPAPEACLHSLERSSPPSRAPRRAPSPG